MLIYEALKKDHDKLKTLLNQLQPAAKWGKEERTQLLNEIRDELVPHSRAEEAIFYNSLRAIDASKALVMHSYAEHAEAETLLHSLQIMDALSADWSALAKKFKAGIEHHISEEEGKVFSAAKQVLVPEEEGMMASAFERLKPEVREQNFVQNTLDLVANLMPSRFASSLRSFNHRI